MKYLNKFGTHSGYTEDKVSLERPSVNYCVDANHVHYDNIPTIITVNLNIPSATTDYFIYKFTDLEECESIRYDGKTLDLSISSEPMIDFTAGEHVIEYVFPHTVVCPSIGYDIYPFNMYIESVIIPKGIRRIESYPCQYSNDLCPSIGQMGAATLSIPSTLEYVGVKAICSDVGIPQEDMARVDSCCPVAPTEEKPHPWRTPCGK